MAVSAILEDIFVANNEYRWDSRDKFPQVVSWKLIRANTLNKEAIYIKNSLHIEPISSLLEWVVFILLLCVLFELFSLPILIMLRVVCFLSSIHLLVCF